MLLVIAAVAFGLLVLAWVLYPTVMWLRGRHWRAPAPTGTAHSRVCAVIATRDDPAFAAARVRNLRESDYPADLLRIVLAVDANAAFDDAAYRAALGGSAEVIRGAPPGGKGLALNAGVAAAGSCDVLLFADVGQQFGPDVVSRLVATIESGAAGATGRYTQRPDDTVMSAWAGFEAAIRAGQAAGRGIVSATGAVLAIRREYWRELPAGIICDDLFTGLSVAMQGGRVVFHPDAVAYDPRPFTRDQQFARRARTLTGLIQYCALVPAVLQPWRNPLWFHFVIHKLLRLLTPILLAFGLLSLATYAAISVPRSILQEGAIGLGAVAVLAIITGAASRRLRDQVLWVARLQLVPVVAILNGLRGRWSVWTPTPQGRG